MYVSVQSYSRRVGAAPGDTLGDDICYFARVSNPTSQVSGLNNDKLLKYLLKHKHFSPFEMATICCQVDTTRDIARQMLRHRSFSFQEFSQRYSATETNGDRREARLQDHVNRQNSLDTDDASLIGWWNDVQDSLMASTFDAYDAALKKGLAKEVARSILPEGLTWTRLYMSGSVRSWLHYIELRTDPSTQKEFVKLYKDNPSKPMKLKDLAKMAGGYQSNRRYPNIKAKPLGYCVDIVYRTVKKPDGLTNYIHTFGEPYRKGEKWSEKPILAVASSGEVFLCGGNYKCKIEGIVN